MRVFRPAAAALLFLGTGCATLVWQDPGRVLSVPSDRAARIRDARSDEILKRRTAEDGTVDLNLPEVVALALARNLGLQAAREERLKAQGDAFSAFARMLPQVGFSGSYVRIDQGTTADIGGMSIKLSPEDRWSGELQIQQPIFQGGMAYHAFEAAQIVARIADLGIVTAEEQISFAVAIAFFDALLARESLAVARENTTLAREHLEDVRKRRAQGMASRFEELRAETQVAATETLEIQAKNTLVVKKLSVLRLAGLPLDTEIRLEGAIASGPLEAGYDQVWEGAERFRPDLAAARAGLLAAEKGIAATRAQLMPKIYGFFNWGWQKPSSKSFVAGAGAGYWNGGLSLSVPIFDGGAVHGQLLKAYAARRQAQYRLQDLQEEIALEIRKSLINIEDAAKAVEASRKGLKLAEEGRRLAKVGYENGINAQLDVLEADNALVKAKFGFLQAVFGHILARESLRRAMGVVRLVAEFAGPPDETPEAPEDTGTPEDEDPGEKK